MRSIVKRAFAGTRPAPSGPRAMAAVMGLLAASLGAVSPAWAGSCSNELFRTGPGSNLPDCRAYEMVSPPDKNGGEVDGGDDFEGVNPAPQQAALDGEAVTFGSQTTFTEADPRSSLVTGQYLSKRGSSGWYTQAVTPEQDLAGGGLDTNPGSLEFSLFQGFSEDLGHAFLAAYNPAPVEGPPANYFSPYVRDNLDGAYQLLSTVTPPAQPPGAPDTGKGGFKPEYAGMSADGAHVVFAANDALTPGAIPGARNLYEWSAGQLELVSTTSPKGEPTSSGSFGFPAEDQGGLFEDNRSVISSDGARVFWTDYKRYSTGTAPLYMRELTAAGARTVEVSASQRTEPDPNGTRPARYWTASRDGGRVFFTSCEKLTNDSTAGGGSYEDCGNPPQYSSGEGEDLYVYDAATGLLNDLAVDPGGSASVSSVIGTSEDGASVYFAASGVLAEGASAGASNIYLWHEGTIRFIAALHEGDYSLVGFHSFISDGSQYLLERAVGRVSPSGRYLTFESSEPLTGYDNLPAQARACERVGSQWDKGSVYGNGTGPCVEVFEYDAATGRLICASCNPTGVPPLGSSNLPFAIHGIEEPAGWQTSTIQQRYLLDNGRLFFDSNDALLPQASNGLLNVYEYEPDAVGGCHTEGGCVSLISSGTSSDNSFFTDASASGNDAFFITRQQLVAQDGDEANDVYDARVGGGISAAAPPPCGGEACRPPVAPAPAIYGAPPSATFVGPGNPPAPAATAMANAKRKVKVKGKRKSRAKRKRAHGRAKGKRARRSVRVRKASGGSHR
jgi:hypothetical protein